MVPEYMQSKPRVSLTVVVTGPVGADFGTSICAESGLSDACTFHGCLRHRTTVPPRWVLAHMSSPSTPDAPDLLVMASVRVWGVHPLLCALFLARRHV